MPRFPKTRRARLLGAIVGLLGFAAIPAAAAMQIREQSQHGPWRVTAGDWQQAGSEFCTVTTNNSDNTRLFSFSMLNNPRAFVIFLTDRGWNLPAQMSGSMTVEVDGIYARRLGVTGAGRDTVLVEFGSAGAEPVVEFLNAFAAGNNMTIRLPDGSALRASLQGSAAAVQRWLICVGQLDAQRGRNPFGQPVRSPFGG